MFLGQSFDTVEVAHLQLVNTSVLYLVGNLSHFSSYSVWPTPWLMQFSRVPFEDGLVELLNRLSPFTSG